jgi:hypothetical protein
MKRLLPLLLTFVHGFSLHGIGTPCTKRDWGRECCISNLFARSQPRSEFLMQGRRVRRALVDRQTSIRYRKTAQVSQNRIGAGRSSRVGHLFLPCDWEMRTSTVASGRDNNLMSIQLLLRLLRLLLVRACFVFANYVCSVVCACGRMSEKVDASF